MFRMDSLKSALRAPFIPKLTSEETNDLPTHIAHTRASIFSYERRINVARTNLLTISRCMKGLLPHTCPISLGTHGIFDLPRAIASLEESSNQITPDQADHLRQQESKRSTAFPVQLIDRPIIIPDAERIISPPRSLNRAYIAALRLTAEGVYYLLKVKKQELKAEMERLESDVRRWGDVYAVMSSSGFDGQTQIQSQSQSLSQGRPEIYTSASFASSHPTLADLEEGSQVLRDRPKGGIRDAQETENAAAVKRKAVPVKDIVRRTMQRADPFEGAYPDAPISKTSRSYADPRNSTTQHSSNEFFSTSQHQQNELPTQKPVGMTRSQTGFLPPKPPPRSSSRLAPWSSKDISSAMTKSKTINEIAGVEYGMSTRRSGLSVKDSSETLQGEMKDGEGRYAAWI